ncbi:hypothetical protein [Planctomicrobium piriforme]|uniref:Thioredoxin domain-containing protein n=1 Tax=Planctomicrobium piriforme TaxID=1576369 RepID=A0A1I3FSS3_9PLAN|nr:hypothetical protein [Planctomicrobium piriforme]SFI14122.1 hypothetical protein SAMN05421753_1067 [Planctomicrobium piriforme]
MKKLLAFAVALTALSTLAFAEGLEVGSPVGAFYVKDVTGPAAGTKLCYRCRYGDRPVISIFARDVNGSVSSLIHEVDAVVGKNQNQDMKAFVVLLTDEPEAGEEALKKVASEARVANTPLTTFDGQAGPAPYKISKDAEVTVMMWVDGKLKVNEAYKAGELTQEKIASLVGKTSQIVN